MRFLLILILLASINTIFAQSSTLKIIKNTNAISNSPDTTKKAEVRICCGAKGNPPMFILNGFVISDSLLANINPNQIQSIDIFKNEAAVEKYGTKAKNGVIDITAKPEAVDELVKRGILKPVL